MSIAAIEASRTTSLIELRTKIDWSNSGVILMFLMPAAIAGMAAFTCDTMSSVEVLPFFSTTSRADRLPFCRTMFVCVA